MEKSDLQSAIEKNMDTEQQKRTDHVRPISTVESTANSPILKLDIDCFDELFEWLPLADLRRLRETCKRLKQVTDYYIKFTYRPAKRGFRRLKIDHENIDQIAKLDPDRYKFINKIWIWPMDLSKTEIDSVKAILNKVDTVEMRNWENATDFDEVFLKHCVNLKCLCIFDVLGDNLMGNGNKWLQRHYPTLERLILLDDFEFDHEGNEIHELKTFFAINSNVRTFATTLQFLWKNRFWLRNSNIHLDRLDIEGIGFEKLDSLFDFVNELHGQGFYKRLHFYGKIIDDDTFMLRVATVHGLEKLYLARIDSNIVLPPLIGVKELNFIHCEDIKHPTALAANIPNVKLIHIRNARIEDILPFIRLSPSVEKIRVECLMKEGDIHLKNDVIDLVALNKERQSLIGAHKITLHVKESIFLATKWSAMEIDCSLIRIKRADPNQNKLFHPHYLFMDDFV